MDQSKRQKMIEETAYYRARQGGFTGDPAEHWLEAEKEVDRILAEGQGGNKEEELAAFANLQKEMGRLLAAMKGNLQEESLRQAMDKAIKEVKEMGQFTSGSVNRAAEALKKDMAHHIETLQGTWQSVSLKTAGLFKAWSRRGVKFLKHAEEAAEAWLESDRKHSERHTYHTGEIAAQGTMTCSSCGHSVKIDTATHLPRCPHCDNTTFKFQR